MFLLLILDIVQQKQPGHSPPPPLYPETTAHLWSLGRPPRRDNYNRVIHLSGSETSERDCFPCGDAAARVKSD